MSGDAQPRKRKNKGKKKGDQVVQKADEFLKERSGFRKLEDSTEEEIFNNSKNSTDEVIHIQKDIICGGNVVTKLIFFGVLATIGVMVGVILLEYRGSTDDETSSALDSPWSVTFENWVDTEADAHAHEEEHDHDDDHDHDHDEHDEGRHDQGGDHSESSGIYSWLSFSRQDTKEEVDSDTDSLADSVLNVFSFSGGGENTDTEVRDDPGETSSWFGFGGGESSDSSGGWFGFGGVEKSEDLDEAEKEERGDIEQEEEESEEKEDETDQEDEDEEEDEEEDTYNVSEEDEEEVDNDAQSGEDEVDNDDQLEEDEDKEADLDEGITSGEEEEEEGIDSEEEEEEKGLASGEEEEEEGLASGEEEEEEGIASGEEEEEDKFDVDYTPASEEEEEENLSDGGEGDDQKEEEDLLPNEEEGDRTDKSVEELFPEAVEALRQEAEEWAARQAAESKKEEEEEIEKLDELQDADSGNESLGEDDETEGMALKFGVGVALVVVAHVVLVKKWNSWAGDDSVDPLAEIPVTTEWKEAVYEEPVVSAPLSKPESMPPRIVEAATPSPPQASIPSDSATFPVVTPSPQAELVEEAAEESPVEEDEDGDAGEEEGAEAEGEEEEEEESEDLEIDKDKFRELIAKYGQDTPESSEVEQSDDDIQKIEYSGEEESGDEGAAEESPAEVVTDEDQAASEDELKEWTGIKKSDIEKITKLDSETESEVEEESEEEPPPPPSPQPSRLRGGPNDFFDEDYQNAFITNEEDWAIKEELDRADEEFNYETARTFYRALLIQYPNSPRARYGLARTFDKQAERERSNNILNVAISLYKDALLAPNIPDILYIQIASRLIDRLRFRGLHLQTVDVHDLLIKKFNNTPEYRTDLAITYLMINKLENARVTLKEVLKYWPHDPTALSHYGLVLKLQGNIHGCIKYFERGMETDFTTPKDARLFFHMGDALTRVGREADAIKVYDKAVTYGLFRSRYQRSLYNVNRLSARPWWTHEQTTYSSFFKLLEDNWLQIRDEGIKALKINGMFRDEAEGLRDKGDWKQFELFARGTKMKKNCEVTPFTCSIIGSFEPAASCKRGQSKFSIMEGGTHVWPHCGPTNCRLRAHLGLIVPEGPKLRVANITKTWKEGKVIIFDDSFEHEVWHDGSMLRLVLIVDVWHPELTGKEKLSLSAI